MGSRVDLSVAGAELPPYLRARESVEHFSFRALLASGTVVLPGVVDVLSARLVERAGFEACYVSGAGFANAQFGLPDLGLTGLSDLVSHVYRISGGVGIPLVVDADTGYGNAISVMHTVAELERAGASAIQLEDQAFPKRCGHFDRRRVIPADEMVQKISAAVRARSRSETVVIGRTDARAMLGFDECVERGKRYREAGADVIFIEAPESEDELERIPSLLNGMALMTNVVEGGRTPVRSVSELEQMGYRIVLYANLALRASISAVRAALAELRRSGDSRRLYDRIASWEERQDLVYLREVEALEDELAGGMSRDPRPGSDPKRAGAARDEG